MQLGRVGRVFSTFSLLLVAHGVVHAQAPTTPSALLKWSMDTYAKLPTFQADCNWSASYGGQPTGATTKRTLWMKKPNLFKVVSSHGGSRMVQTSVSDGKQVVEFATGVGTPAMRYTAPASISEAVSMQMAHPMFCGSLLYKFFGGSKQYAALVDGGKMPITFGPTVTLDGQPCKTVKFWAQGQTYGKTEITIGEKDGLVRRIRYGSEPLMQMMKSMVTQEQIKKMAKTPEEQKQLLKNMPTSSLTTETYVHIVTGKPIAPALFVAKAPEGMQMQTMGGGSEPQPPVPLGKPAPEISVTDVNGVKRKLADFRGKVVLIDFWATWCPPCRKGLPETQRFHTEYGQRGLAVLTISAEEKATVLPFVKQNKYTFPVYLDAERATNKAYHIAAIPTVAVIDKRGNLVAYKVGLMPREDILAALKAAGLATR